MKATPLLACLLAALPAAALADTHGGDRGYARNAPQQSHYTERQPQWHDNAQRYDERQQPRYDERQQPRYDDRPRYRNDLAVRQPWQWNGGHAWVARSNNWGGGFWGSLTIGLAPNAYAVQQGSPGADLLAQYGLQQTGCDQPNLVSIYGPDGGQICAYPNDQVSPGAYHIDPATLSLIPSQY